MNKPKYPETVTLATLPDGSTTEVDLRELGIEGRQQALAALEAGNFIELTEDNASQIGINVSDALEIANRAALLEEIAIKAAPDRLYRHAIELCTQHGAGAILAEITPPQCVFLVHYLLTGNIQKSAKLAGVSRKSPYNWLQTAKFREAFTSMRSTLNSLAFQELVVTYLQDISIPTLLHELASMGA